MPLKTEQDTPAMEARVLAAAVCSINTQSHPPVLESTFEHGQWWVSCLDCGAQWSVVDAEGGESVDGFDFEQVSEGDGSCNG